MFSAKRVKTNRFTSIKTKSGSDFFHYYINAKKSLNGYKGVLVVVNENGEKQFSKVITKEYIDKFDALRDAEARVIRERENSLDS